MHFRSSSHLMTCTFIGNKYTVFWAEWDVWLRTLPFQVALESRMQVVQSSYGAEQTE